MTSSSSSSFSFPSVPSSFPSASHPASSLFPLFHPVSSCLLLFSRQSFRVLVSRGFLAYSEETNFEPQQRNENPLNPLLHSVAASIPYSIFSAAFSPSGADLYLLLSHGRLLLLDWNCLIHSSAASSPTRCWSSSIRMNLPCAHHSVLRGRLICSEFLSLVVSPTLISLYSLADFPAVPRPRQFKATYVCSLGNITNSIAVGEGNSVEIIQFNSAKCSPLPSPSTPIRFQLPAAADHLFHLLFGVDDQVLLAFFKRNQHFVIAEFGIFYDGPDATVSLLSECELPAAVKSINPEMNWLRLTNSNILVVQLDSHICLFDVDSGCILCSIVAVGFSNFRVSASGLLCVHNNSEFRLIDLKAAVSSAGSADGVELVQRKFEISKEKENSSSPAASSISRIESSAMESTADEIDRLKSAILTLNQRQARKQVESASSNERVATKKLLSLGEPLADSIRPAAAKLFLDLHYDSQHFHRLISLGFPRHLQSLQSDFPVSDRIQLRRLLRLLSALNWEIPAVESAAFLPQLAFPISSLFGSNSVAAFEVTRIILHAGRQIWLETLPNPSVGFIAAFGRAIRILDSKLAASIHQSRSLIELVLSLFNSLLSEQLNSRGFRYFFDQWMARKPDFIVFAALAIIAQQRKELLINRQHSPTLQLGRCGTEIVDRAIRLEAELKSRDLMAHQTITRFFHAEWNSAKYNSAGTTAEAESKAEADADEPSSASGSLVSESDSVSASGSDLVSFAHSLHRIRSIDDLASIQAEIELRAFNVKLRQIKLAEARDGEIEQRNQVRRKTQHERATSEQQKIKQNREIRKTQREKRNQLADQLLKSISQNREFKQLRVQEANNQEKLLIQSIMEMKEDNEENTNTSSEAEAAESLAESESASIDKEAD